ncbi:MAG TPA: hypothetical protein VF060_05090 [Trebonia sp.]
MSAVTAQGYRPAPRAHHLSDVLVLTGRNLAHIAREPLRLSEFTIQPVVFTLLFVYVFGGRRSRGRAATPRSPSPGCSA